MASGGSSASGVADPFFLTANDKVGLDLARGLGTGSLVGLGTGLLEGLVDLFCLFID